MLCQLQDISSLATLKFEYKQSLCYVVAHAQALLSALGSGKKVNFLFI